MEGKPVPASLTGIIDPLREADRYARLQLQRQRGVYNILTGLPGLFFLFPMNGLSFLIPDLDGAAKLAMLAVGWTLFIVSCYTHRLLLPFIRRRRPDWEASFLEASLVKKALEKQFWFQAPLFMAYFFFVTLGSVSLALLLFRDHDFGIIAILTWFQVTLQVIAMAIMAFHSRRAQDKSVETLYWFALPLAFLPLLFPVHQVPVVGAWALFAFCLVMPPLIAGAFRLLAPRRWLVR